MWASPCGLGQFDVTAGVERDREYDRIAALRATYVARDVVTAGEVATLPTLALSGEGNGHGAHQSFAFINRLASASMSQSRRVIAPPSKARAQSAAYRARRTVYQVPRDHDDGHAWISSELSTMS